jgi:hypothetical protein
VSRKRGVASSDSRHRRREARLAPPRLRWLVSAARIRFHIAAKYSFD